MKKLMILAAALLFAATSVMAVTPEEKQASADRIESLKAAAPKECGIAKIDDAVAKSKKVADGTVAISGVSAALAGDVDAAKLEELAQQIKTATMELSEVGKMMGDAAGALKEVKNPLKLKPATKSLGYAEHVLKTAGEELMYQGKVVAEMVKK